MTWKERERERKGTERKREENEDKRKWKDRKNQEKEIAGLAVNGQDIDSNGKQERQENGLRRLKRRWWRKPDDIKEM